jgi:hypothetical protein
VQRLRDAQGRHFTRRQRDRIGHGAGRSDGYEGQRRAELAEAREKPRTSGRSSGRPKDPLAKAVGRALGASRADESFA